MAHTQQNKPNGSTTTTMWVVVVSSIRSMIITAVGSSLLRRYTLVWMLVMAIAFVLRGFHVAFYNNSTTTTTASLSQHEMEQLLLVPQSLLLLDNNTLQLSQQQQPPTNHPTTIQRTTDNQAAVVTTTTTTKSVETALHHPNETTTTASRTTTTTTSITERISNNSEIAVGGSRGGGVYMPLAPWEQASIDQRECNQEQLPPGTPAYCCLGTLSSRAKVTFEAQKCRKPTSVYRRNEQLALDSLQPLNNDQQHEECDVCRIIDVLGQYNKTWAMVGDSITGQSFFALECELRRRNIYNVTMLDVDYRKERPERFWYHLYGLNKIHELHVTPLIQKQSQQSQSTSTTNVIKIRYYVMYRPPSNVTEILSNNDVILFDFGLHYGEFYSKPESAIDFERDMTQWVSAVVAEKIRHPTKLIAWRETSAQHFNRPNGEYDSSSAKDKKCVAMNLNYNNSNDTTTTNLTTRRQIMERVFQSVMNDNATTTQQQQQIIPIVPFWNYTRQFHELHANDGFGDCAHYCSTPSFWLYLWREWRRTLDHHIADVVVMNQWEQQ